MITATTDNFQDARILVVDGEERVRHAYCEMLKNTGFEAETAKDFSVAEKLIRERSFDAVFTDIFMPDTDGIELLKKIKEIQPDTQVIMVTGYPSVDTASEAVRSGAYDYLTKPVTQRVLTRVAKRAVETKRLKEEKRRLEEENRVYRENLEKLVEEGSQKLTEAELEQMRLATAIEQSTESIIVPDTDGIIQYVNPAFEVITGYKKDEAVGQNPRLLKSGRQDDRFYREMWETIENGNVWRGHFINKKKDGGLFDEEATISPVRSAEGKIMNYVAIKRDVTEKKRLESLAEAANLMDNIGYVFSGIRHELGNPINSIKMTLTVLNASLETFDRETVQEFLERSLNEVARVEYLLKALRNFSMFETPRVQSLRIDTFMEKFLSLVADDFKRKGINIETLSAAWAIKGLVDPRALQQVMLNLITNAADALTIRENPRIDIDFNKAGGYIHVKVIDNGCGMSPEQRKDLFKPFFTSKAGGTGLGLVIAKKMLSEMNCTIDIDSQMDVGTTVTISIPEGK